MVHLVLKDVCALWGLCMWQRDIWTLCLDPSSLSKNGPTPVKKTAHIVLHAFWVQVGRGGGPSDKTKRAEGPLKQGVRSPPHSGHPLASTPDILELWGLNNVNKQASGTLRHYVGGTVYGEGH